MDSHRFCPTTLIEQGLGLCIEPEDIILPFYNVHASNYYRPWKRYTERDTKDFGSTIYNEKDKYKITLDVQHFKPNEINVKVVDNEIIIEGNHKEREDSHGFISRNFKRRYFLPKDCIADSVVSSLSSDGILTVTADKNLELKSKEITVPIKLCDNILNQQVLTSKADIIHHSQDTNTNSDIDKSKKCTTIMLKEDHSRLLKPEFFGKPSTAATEKTMKQDETKKDKAFTGSTKSDQLQDIKISSKIDEKSQESDTAANVMMVASVVESSPVNMETTNVNNMSTETLQIEESTSYSSTITSSVKEKTEKITGIVSDISAQLKEAAENI